MNNLSPKQQYFQRRVNDMQSNIDRIMPSLLTYQEQYRHNPSDALLEVIESKKKEIKKWKHQQHKYLPFCQF